MMFRGAFVRSPHDECRRRAEWYNTSPNSSPLGDSSIGCVGHSARRRCEDDERCDVKELEAHGSKMIMLVPSSGCLINIEIS
jgi:hypothetical protein